MGKLKTKEFWDDTLGRAIRTFCQSALSLMTVGTMLLDLDLISIASISATSALMCVFTCIARSGNQTPTDEEGDE